MSETRYLGLQINIICVLVALIGLTLITQHPKWFGDISAKTHITKTSSGGR